MVSGVISLEFSYSFAPFVASLLLGLFSTAEPHQVRYLFIFLSCDSAYLNINKAEGPFYQQTVPPPPPPPKKNKKNKQTKHPPQKKKKKKPKKTNNNKKTASKSLHACRQGKLCVVLYRAPGITGKFDSVGHRIWQERCTISRKTLLKLGILFWLVVFISI